MLNLLRAEGARTVSRRITWIALACALVASCFALWGVYEMVRPVSEADKASYQAIYERELQQFEKDKASICGTDETCIEKARPRLEYFGRSQASAKDVTQMLAPLGGYFGFFLALIVAASIMASEFATGSMSNYLTFVPNRLKVFASKYIVGFITSVILGAIVMLFLLGGALAITALSGVTLSGTEGATEGIRMGLRALFLPAIGGALGLLMATILRHTAAAVGLAFGYMFVSGIFTAAIMAFKLYTLAAYMPENTFNAIIAGRYVWSSWAMGPDDVPYQLVIHWSHAALYWAIFLSALTIFAAWLFKRRDVS